MPKRPESFCTLPEWAAQVNICETGAVWQPLRLKTGPLLQPDLGSRANSCDAQIKIIFLWRAQTKLGEVKIIRGIKDRADLKSRAWKICGLNLQIMEDKLHYRSVSLIVTY